LGEYPAVVYGVDVEDGGVDVVAPVAVVVPVAVVAVVPVVDVVAVVMLDGYRIVRAGRRGGEGESTRGGGEEGGDMRARWVGDGEGRGEFSDMFGIVELE